MIRIHGLPREQLAALMALMADNESFDRRGGSNGLTVIDGGLKDHPHGTLRRCGSRRSALRTHEGSGAISQ